jgi:hypothetical protein
MALLPHGQIDRSLALREKLLAVGLERNSAQTHCWALLGLAEIAILRHELPAALDYLERAKSFVEKIGLAETIWMYGLLARAQWRLGQTDLAREAAGRGAAIAAKATPVNFNVLEGYAGIAEVYLNLWETDAAEAPAARKAIKQLNRFAHTFPISAARALLMQGRAAWLSGQHATARALWHKSLAAAEEREVRYDQGLAHYEIGRHLDRGDAAHAQHLQQAMQIFSDLRAACDFDRARSELAQSQTATTP